MSGGGIKEKRRRGRRQGLQRLHQGGEGLHYEARVPRFPSWRRTDAFARSVTLIRRLARRVDIPGSWRARGLARNGSKEEVSLTILAGVSRSPDRTKLLAIYHFVWC